MKQYHPKCFEHLLRANNIAVKLASASEAIKKADDVIGRHITKRSLKPAFNWTLEMSSEIKIYHGSIHRGLALTQI